MQPGPYGAAPVAPSSVEPLKPNGWWYVAAAALGIGGIVLAVTIGVRTVQTYFDRIDDFQRVDVPGSGTVELEEGSYTLYQEYDGANDSFRFAPSITVNVTAPDGSAVDLDDYSSTITYSDDDHEGEALFSFRAEESGEYRVSAEGDSSSVVAVGPGLGGGLAMGITLAVVSGALGVIGGIVVAIIVAVKRSGSKTRRQLALVGSGYRPPGPPGYSPPGGWPPSPQPMWPHYQPQPQYQPPPPYQPPAPSAPPAPPPPPEPPASSPQPDPPTAPTTPMPGTTPPNEPPAPA